MANEYLKRTTTSAGNQRTWTWAGWVKLNNVSDAGELFQAGNDATPTTGDLTRIIAMDNNAFCLLGDNTSGMRIINDGDNRDPAQWYHVVAAYDSTAGLEEERGRIFVNGVKIKKLNAGGTFPAINKQYAVNAGITSHHIGINGRNFTNTLEGELSDIFFVDGQALTPDVFGFYKEGKGYISVGSTQSTDFRPGQWVPKAPRTIKSEINRKGGFGVNGFYLPMNDSSNFGADFHTTPNSIITLKGEDLPQPQNGAPTTTDAYVSQLRADPYAANLVLAIPFISGGQGSGAGDYSADIKGSGTNKTVTLNGTFAVGECASYYGSALKGSSGNRWVEVAANSDFANLYDVDHTIEFWYKNDAWTGGYLPHNDIMGLNVSGTTNVAWRITFTDKNVNNQQEDGIELFGDSTFSTGQQILNNDWNHCAVVQEGNNTTIYINGVAQNRSGKHGYAANKASTGPIIIGADPRVNPQDGSTYLYNGQLQDIRIYKGVAKYTGGFDVPKPYTPVGISTWRAVPDSTANNFATLNPLDRKSGHSMTLSNGNLTFSTSSGSAQQRGIQAGIGVTSGKWYYEARVEVFDGNWLAGWWESRAAYSNYPTYYWDIGANNASPSVGGVESSTGTNSGTAPTLVIGDIIGVALDYDGDTITYYKNGTQTVQTTGMNIPDGLVLIPTIQCWTSANNNGTSVNFGQNPTFSGNTTAGTYADSNGKGLFKYQPPSGFLALCEDNLPTPAIADPGDYFKTMLWTGDGNNGRSITGLGFKPDLVWMKARHDTWVHGIYDSIRGPLDELSSDNTGAASIESDSLFSFNDDGFSYGTRVVGNQDGGRYVAWCWKAGGAAVSNTDGTITSQVSANQTAGFSIVNWTSNGATSVVTTGHGLAKTPKFILLKNRDAVDNWFIYHESIQTNNRQYLQFTTSATTTSPSDFWSTSSSTFGIRQSSIAVNGAEVIAYCWTEIEGFSKFGSFEANGVSDGPFVYLGFKPAFLLCKNIDATEAWLMKDSSRQPTNPNEGFLLANSTTDENFSVGNDVDFLSNGFKIRTTNNPNTSGNTYVFAAFAESPFTTANAK